MRDERVPALDRDQSAEPAAEHEHRPDPQRTAGGEEHDAEPAHGVTVDGPQLSPVGVGRHIRQQQRDHTERHEHPAVAAILALARAEISRAEQRGGREYDKHDRKRDQGRMGKEGGKAAQPENREPQIGEGPDDGEED